MKIVPYDSQYRQAFVDLNKAWITDLFTLEPEDISVLNGVDGAVNGGAQVYFAIDDNGDVMACCMVTPLESGQWEIEKFAARGMYSGTGAGSACFSACLDWAVSHDANRIVIVSNRKCVHALSIYRRFGFKEIPVDKELFPFERADIAMEKRIGSGLSTDA